MIDVSLFRTPAFRPQRPVTVAFFALFGFIFLVTQYFQFIRGYGTLSTGVRILPVATTIAIGSVAGVALAGRVGTRAVVTTGLVLLGSSFGWIALSPTLVPYGPVVGQMVLMGLGLGLTTAPATESILSVLRREGRRRLGRQRRDPRGRRDARRRRARQHLHLAVRDRIGAASFAQLPTRSSRLPRTRSPARSARSTRSPARPGVIGVEFTHLLDYVRERIVRHPGSGRRSSARRCSFAGESAMPSSRSGPRWRSWSRRLRALLQNDSSRRCSLFAIPIAARAYSNAWRPFCRPRCSSESPLLRMPPSRGHPRG